MSDISPLDFPQTPGVPDKPELFSSLGAYLKNTALGKKIAAVVARIFSNTKVADAQLSSEARANAGELTVRVRERAESVQRRSQPLGYEKEDAPLPRSDSGEALAPQSFDPKNYGPPPPPSGAGEDPKAPPPHFGEDYL